MKNLENQLKEKAIYDHEEITPTNVKEILDRYEHDFFDEGILSRVYKIKDTGYVVKEGKWSLVDPELFRSEIVNIDTQQLTETLHDITSLLYFKFLPDKEKVALEYSRYLKVIEYFGFFNETGYYHHPLLDEIYARQKDIRNNLPKLQHPIEKKLKTKLPKAVKILFDEVLYENYLPREFMLFGESYFQDTNKHTYFIFQEHIEGKKLSEVSFDDLSYENKLKLLFFAYITLAFYVEENLVLDLRPDKLNPLNKWFLDTGNVVVGENQIRLVDTRSQWDTSSRVVERGLFIPELIILNVRNFLVSGLKKL